VRPSDDRLVRVIRLRPSRPWFRPGSDARVEIAIQAMDPVSVGHRVSLVDVDRVVAVVEGRFRLPKGPSERTVAIQLPGARRHGYGLRLDLSWTGGRTAATTALEALDGWWQSPRHAAVTAFRSPVETTAAVRELADWHVTVVQLYDWMYRHYRYSPPTGTTFTDTLGRRVSHDAVRAGVRAGHGAGIASLAYGSIYGAEREYVERHPDERVFDTHGAPLSLGETFYINDPRPGPWRRRLLREYVGAVRRFQVDGIHMDTYGPPHEAIGADGQAIRFDAVYPGLIAEAAALVAAVRPDAKVLFNCVEGFPLQRVAASPTAALYLELWPRDADWVDIVRWIDRARDLGAGRAVVIAAYISALRANETDPAARAGAIEAAILLGAVIAAAGGYHHVLAEGDRLLVEGYYPEARALRRSERNELRAASAFTARYVHLLSDPALVVLPAIDVEVLDREERPITVSDRPRSGALWVRLCRTTDGLVVLQLVDLLDQLDDRWDAVRQPSPMRSGWRIRWPAAVDAAHVVAMSPWNDRGEAQRLIDDRLPAFRRWLVLVARPSG
jgi:dextranase